MKTPKTLLLCLLLAVTGCSGVKQQLGVGRNSPDEFAVVKRAPLTLPPDYALRPPSAADKPPATDASDQARTALLGKQAVDAVKGDAEKSLLDKMGAANANPEIRTVLNKDNGTIALQNQTVADKLIFWKDGAQGDDSKTPSTIVDPKAEAARLKKNKEEDKPVNDGKTPTIEKKQSTFDKIF